MILGVDPGLQRTGYGVVACRRRQVRVLQAGVVRSREGDPLEQRLREIYQGVAEVLEMFRCQAMAVEELYSAYRHPKTAILMAHARGAVLLAAAEKAIPVFSYSATQIKKALTGSGRAGKAEVQTLIQREFGLARLPQPADVADALAAALCHYQASRWHRLGVARP